MGKKNMDLNDSIISLAIALSRWIDLEGSKYAEQLKGSDDLKNMYIFFSQLPTNDFSKIKPEDQMAIIGSLSSTICLLMGNFDLKAKTSKLGESVEFVRKMIS